MTMVSDLIACAFSHTERLLPGHAEKMLDPRPAAGTRFLGNYLTNLDRRELRTVLSQEAIEVYVPSGGPDLRYFDVPLFPGEGEIDLYLRKDLLGKVSLHAMPINGIWRTVTGDDIESTDANRVRTVLRRHITSEGKEVLVVESWCIHHTKFDLPPLGFGRHLTTLASFLEAYRAHPDWVTVRKVKLSDEAVPIRDLAVIFAKAKVAS